MNGNWNSHEAHEFESIVPEHSSYLHQQGESQPLNLDFLSNLASMVTSLVETKLNESSHHVDNKFEVMQRSLQSLGELVQYQNETLMEVSHRSHRSREARSMRQHHDLTASRLPPRRVDVPGDDTSSAQTTEDNSAEYVSQPHNVPNSSQGTSERLIPRRPTDSSPQRGRGSARARLGYQSVTLLKSQQRSTSRSSNSSNSRRMTAGS